MRFALASVMFGLGLAAVGLSHVSRTPLPYPRPTAAEVPLLDSLRPLDIDTFRQLIAAKRDTVVLVDFWATWCAPCRAELPGWVALERRFVEHRLQLVTVSVDDSADIPAAVRFLDSISVRTPRYIKRTEHDTQFIDAVDTAWSGALPALFIYDRTGRQRARFVGETTLRQVEEALAPLLVPAVPHATIPARSSH